MSSTGSAASARGPLWAGDSGAAEADKTSQHFSWEDRTMTLAALIAAAALEVGGDYLIRIGLPHGWGRMLAGALLLALYGFAVNLFWRGDFSRLLGLYVVVFFVVSQVWGVVAEREGINVPRLLGGALIVTGGLVIQLWQPSK
jgi:drug/metabolite transporter superfamily protein YnfA